ncbi:hypothetical protein ABV23_RS01140 [Escherichia coli]|nr:hypothetical protein [Escherichia coli]
MNKHEVLVFDNKFYVPTCESTESYYLINNIMSATQTCCRQRPGEYEFSQTIGYYRYTELESFTIDSKKVIDVLISNGYNEQESNNTDLPVVEIVLKNS